MADGTSWRYGAAEQRAEAEALRPNVRDHNYIAEVLDPPETSDRNPVDCALTSTLPRWSFAVLGLTRVAPHLLVRCAQRLRQHLLEL